MAQALGISQLQYSILTPLLNTFSGSQANQTNSTNQNSQVNGANSTTSSNSGATIDQIFSQMVQDVSSGNASSFFNDSQSFFNLLQQGATSSNSSLNQILTQIESGLNGQNPQAAQSGFQDLMKYLLSQVSGSSSNGQALTYSSTSGSNQNSNALENLIQELASGQTPSAQGHHHHHHGGGGAEALQGGGQNSTGASATNQSGGGQSGQQTSEQINIQITLNSAPQTTSLISFSA